MEISVLELLKKKNVNIIDIRNPIKYLAGHIPGAISIEFKSLVFYPEKYLRKGEDYYLYCDSGVRSKVLTQKLKDMGYSVISIIGGYNNYLLTK